MGRRGPAPEPVAAKLARGETRPSRVNFDQPLPRQRDPRMPDGLDPAAQAVWRHVLREMRGSGVIVGADRDILRIYAETMASYIRNRALLQGSGSVIVGARGGEVVVNPLARVVRAESDMLRLLARELGLTPSARAGLRIDLGAEQHDMDDILPPLPRPRLLDPDADDG